MIRGVYPVYPKQLEKKFNKIYKKFLLPLVDKKAGELLGEGVNLFNLSFDTEVEDEIKKWANSFIVWHKNKIGRMNKVVGSEIFAIKNDLSDAIIDEFVSRNVGLIKDRVQAVNGTNFSSVMERLTKAGRGISRETLKETIQEELGIGESKAEFWARDQVGKLNAEVDKYKYQQAGIETATWICSFLPTSRDSHIERHGKVFNLEEGLDGLKPGEDYNCYCWSMPSPSGVPAMSEDEIAQDKKIFGKNEKIA